MTPLIYLFIAFWISVGVGRTLLGKMRALDGLRLELLVYSAALGLGIAAYGVLAIGLMHQLQFNMITGWWVFLAIVGVKGQWDTLRDLIQLHRPLPSQQQSEPSQASAGSAIHLLAPVSIAVLLFCGTAALLATYKLPAGHEWDVLAYHLADPKIYIANGTISSLPTEHHSNFPFTVEMLYTVGLLYEGVTLANQFHWLMGLLTVLGVIAFTRRLVSPGAGWVAGVVLVTTPLFLWESSVAYIDVGLGLYTTLSVFAAVSAMRERNRNASSMSNPSNVSNALDISKGMKGSKGSEESERMARQWLLLAGAMMGVGLGIKYLALIPFAIVAFMLLASRISFRSVFAYVAVAVVVGSPWYVKSVVLTNNPVYPFLFSVFKHSRYWSAERGEAYQKQQSDFGFPHAIPLPSKSVSLSEAEEKWKESVRWAIRAPWSTVARRSGTADDIDPYADPGDYTFSVFVGGLFGAFVFSLAFLKNVSADIRRLAWIGVLQFFAWYFIAQVGRYLVVMAPIFAVVAGYAAWRICGGSDLQEVSIGQTPLRRPGLIDRFSRSAVSLIAGLLVVGQAVMTIWALVMLPSGAREAADSRLMLTAMSFQDSLHSVEAPEDRYGVLGRHLDIYDDIDWINKNTLPTDGVVIIDDARGLYLNRPYLWGNRLHSSYIPYDTLSSGEELTSWLRFHGIRYALINMNWFPGRDQSPVGREFEVYRSWYVDTPPPDKWRRLMADAMRSGLWSPVHSSGHGAIVVRIGAMDAPAGAMPYSTPSGASQ